MRAKSTLYMHARAHEERTAARQIARETKRESAHIAPPRIHRNEIKKCTPSPSLLSCSSSLCASICLPCSRKTSAVRFLSPPRAHLALFHFVSLRAITLSPSLFLSHPLSHRPFSSFFRPFAVSPQYSSAIQPT